jgi:NADH-quinone oxidoreductase subunit C
MADEKKDPPKADEGAGKPAPKTPAEGGGANYKAEAVPPPKPSAEGGTPPVPPAKPATVVPAKPAAAAPAKPAAPAAGAGAPAKPAAAPRPPAAPKAPIKPDPWASPLVDALQKKFPGAISEAVIFRNQPSLNVAKDQLVAVCEFLKGTEGGAYTFLTDETAVDFPKREKRFDVVYHLYSFEGNNRLRLRVQVAAGEKVPSVTAVWPTANWLEREIFDMFGIEYEGHPNLKRILMPDEWAGHPLRKDYDILKQDQAWVKANLGIESGQ